MKIVNGMTDPQTNGKLDAHIAKAVVTKTKTVQCHSPKLP